jgi:hypothetical protein
VRVAESAALTEVVGDETNDDDWAMLSSGKSQGPVALSDEDRRELFFEIQMRHRMEMQRRAQAAAAMASAHAALARSAAAAAAP